MMILIRLGKGECLSHITPKPLAQRIVPPFHMCSLPSFLSNTAMGCSRENVSISMPKIAEGMAVFVSLWNRLPEAETGRFAAVTYDECHYLPRSAAHGCPHPPFLLFLLYKTPDFIQFENIIWCCRQKGLLDIGQFLNMGFEPLRNRLPRNDKDPCNSTQTATLQTSPQHGLLLRFRIRLLWLEHAICTTVLAMVVSISATIGSIFDNMCTLTDTADMRRCFLNHDPDYNSSLTI